MNAPYSVRELDTKFNSFEDMLTENTRGINVKLEQILTQQRYTNGKVRLHHQIFITGGTVAVTASVVLGIAQPSLVSTILNLFVAAL